MNPVLWMSAKELARRIREGDLSSREVVEAHLARVERVNGRLNAVVHHRLEEARAEAKRADERLRVDGPEGLPPLHGVPCTIKESFAVAGMRQTGGLWARRGHVAREDAAAVARIRAAGAIPLGVTNVPELCFWLETNNAIYGRTNNPYDLRRTAGGSSGGEGAIVGSGGSPFGLGSDIAGSIRLPAFFNGVFGHKPSAGLVSTAGHWPMPEGSAARFAVAGPIARRAEDLMLVMRVLVGEGDAAREGACQLGDSRQVRMADLHVFSVEGDGGHRVHPELIHAQRRALAALSAAGARSRVIEISALRRAFEIYTAMLQTANESAFADLISPGREFRGIVELVRWAIGASRHTLPAIGVALVEPLGERLSHRMRPLVAMGEALRAELASLLGPRGVLLYPTYTEPAPRHTSTLFPPSRVAFTAILNVLELPVTQVPLGLGRRGLPLGVQVAAAHGNDHVTIAVAEHLERKLGGWVPPLQTRARTRSFWPMAMPRVGRAETRLLAG